jgi:hypothetical protein
MKAADKLTEEHIGGVEDDHAREALMLLFERVQRLERAWLSDRRKLRNLQHFARRGGS